MKSFILALVVLAAPLSVVQATSYSNSPNNAFVNFGVPGVGGAMNHMIVPEHVKINQQGIVNFAIVSGADGAASGSGFHQVTVYKVADRTSLDSIAGQIEPGSDYDIFDKAGRLVLHVTAGAPRVDSDPSGLRVFIEASASNAPRIVGVHFPEPGTYLVICNVRSHLDDGMIAIVNVKRTWGHH